MGTFDLFHAGHAAFLKRCRRLVGVDGEVIVGLNTDEFAESYKRRPTIGFGDRMTVLYACRYVDVVLPNDQPNGSAREFIYAVEPDIVAATMDYHPSNGKNWFAQIGVPEAWFDEQGIRIEWIPYTQGVSSSEIMSRL